MAVSSKRRHLKILVTPSDLSYSYIRYHLAFMHCAGRMGFPMCSVGPVLILSDYGAISIFGQHIQIL